jgi:hypothetical protein
VGNLFLPRTWGNALRINPKNGAPNEFMKRRYDAFDRDIKNIIKGDTAPQEVFFQNVLREEGGLEESHLRKLGRNRAKLYWIAIRRLQFYVDLTTWHAAYAQGQQLFPGNDEKAQHHANRMVARSQGSGELADRTRMERGTWGPNSRQAESARLFTSFMTYYSAKHNLQIYRWGAWKRGKGCSLRRATGRLISDMTALWVAEGLLLGAASYAWKTLDPFGDEEEPESLWDEIDWRMIIATPFAGVPFLREFGGMVQGFPPSFGGGVGALTQYAYNAGRGATWDEDLSFLENVAEQDYLGYFGQQLSRLAGILLHLPAGQITATWRAFQAEAEGDEPSLREWFMGPDWEKE